MKKKTAGHPQSAYPTVSHLWQLVGLQLLLDDALNVRVLSPSTLRFLGRPFDILERRRRSVLSDLVQEGRDLRKEEKTLTIILRQVIGIDDTVFRHPVYHFPIAAQLAPRSVQRIVELSDLFDVVIALGPELKVDGVSILSRLGFPAHLVDAKHQIGIVVVGLVS